MIALPASVPPRILARYGGDEPVEIARGADHTQLADERALTANMGPGWTVWRVVSLTNWQRAGPYRR